MGVSFAELLARLSPADVGTFRVHPIPGAREHYVGRSATGQPCVLLGSSAGRLHAPVRLAAIEVRFCVACRINPLDGDAREEVLTVVTCTSEEAQVQGYFLHVCETIVRILGPALSQASVVNVVQRLIDLFQRLTRQSSRSVFGLIGELQILACSRDAPMAARAWRSEDAERFDFAIGDARLDVKASGERVRIHFLSAEQCRPPPGTIGILASLFVESSGGGMSLQELVREVERRLASHGDLVLKVEEVVAETLGEALPTALGMRFAERLARASLQLYDLAVVPAVRDGIPAEVTQVRFRSDLSRTPTLALS
ncbi:MAG TPA: PD-(D/E)XK motif protein, partial [Trueperaceae bacterium]|nr:PD-(D/E)XK motif protein [Trueperaceae bacterium]